MDVAEALVESESLSTPQDANGENDGELGSKEAFVDPDEQLKKKKKKKKKKKTTAAEGEQTVDGPEDADGVTERQKEEEREGEVEGEGEDGASEKKKKKRKKKKGGGGGAEAFPVERNPNGILLLYDGSYAEPTEVRPSKPQTYPPSIPVDELFPGGRYPTGQEVPYQGDHTSSSRLTLEEKKAVEREQLHVYSDIRRAAEAHRQVRRYMQSVIQPGMKMIDICETLEECSRRMIREQGLEAGEELEEEAGLEEGVGLETGG